MNRANRASGLLVKFLRLRIRDEGYKIKLTGSYSGFIDSKLSEGPLRLYDSPHCTDSVSLCKHECLTLLSPACLSYVQSGYRLGCPSPGRDLPTPRLCPRAEDLVNGKDWDLLRQNPLFLVQDVRPFNPVWPGRSRQGDATGPFRVRRPRKHVEDSVKDRKLYSGKVPVLFHFSIPFKGVFCLRFKSIIPWSEGSVGNRFDSK